MKQSLRRIFLLSETNCIQVFVRVRNWITARPRLVRFVAPAVLFAILLAPSIWMLSAIPPLWRDVDAYLQVTGAPGSETILHYGPLYCFMARIPLYFGFAIDCLKASAPLPNASFFARPVLSDSGVLALVVLQHLGLGLATFHFIATTTRSFWIRLTLIVVWAANPLFYTFAHCIGTETLSMILMLLIGATGLRIVRNCRKISKKEWFLFCILLWLSILTRHINAALAGLLPLTMFLLASYRVIRMRFACRKLIRRWHWLLAAQNLEKATFAVIAGILCILLANGALRAICYAAQTPYHSALGFTFLFRLKFLAGLTAQERNQLLKKVSRNSDSPDVKNVISLLQRELPAGASSLDVGAFRKQLETSLSLSQMAVSGDTVDAALTHTAWAFLYPPQRVFLRAVAADFNRSQEITIPDVVRFLFVTTTFYFSHSASMPQFASLITFRDKNADEIFAIFKRRPYFHHPKNFNFRILLFFWLVSVAVFIRVAKIRKQAAAAAASYAAALTLTGLLIMLVNCFLTVFQPRFTLPMWELTIMSVTILLGAIMENLVSALPLFPRNRRRK